MCASIVFTQVDGTYCRSFTNTNASQGFGEGVPICLGTGGVSPLSKPKIPTELDSGAI